MNMIVREKSQRRPKPEDDAYWLAWHRQEWVETLWLLLYCLPLLAFVFS